MVLVPIFEFSRSESVIEFLYHTRSSVATLRSEHFFNQRDHFVSEQLFQRCRPCAGIVTPYQHCKIAYHIVNVLIHPTELIKQSSLVRWFSLFELSELE